MPHYYLSEDQERLCTLWQEGLPAERRFRLPSRRFFQSIHNHLCAAIGDVFDGHVLPVSASCAWLTQGLQRLMRTFPQELLRVSLDRVYVPDADLYLDLNRIVQRSANGRAFVTLRGEGPRPGCRPVGAQLDKVASLDRRRGQPGVLLIDEGIFSGRSLVHLGRALERRGVAVRAIVVGILVVRPAIEEIPWSLSVVQRVPREYLTDWVCERDFLPGTPLSGRTLGRATAKGSVPDHRNIGIPYLYGFGDYRRWASIPAAKARRFTAHCLHQAIRLYAEMGRRSGRPVLVADLPRAVYGLRARSRREPMVDCLRRHLSALED